MKKRVDIAVVLDRSGSMQSIKGATINGFNEFISDQLEMKLNTRVTLMQFDDVYEVLYESVKLKHINELNNETYQPRGMTALLDAIGNTIKILNDKYKRKKKENRPEKVLFVIITDGHENSSSHYTRKMIFKKIKKMEDKRGWEFIFLGANQDAIREAGNYGIKARKAMNFTADNLGTINAFKSVKKNVMHCMAIDKEFEFTDEDRRKQEHE